MNSLKKIKEWLNIFTPFNEQEQVDCQHIRQFLEEEPNLLLRDNVKMHFTASAWVLNPKKDKVLMLYHNIYQSWSWSGGHADGEGDLLSVAMKEVKEEKLKSCPEENSKVGWLSPDEAGRSSTEAWMKPIYEKLNQKMRWIASFFKTIIGYAFIY